MELIMKGWEVLVEMGYQPEVAYFEVLNEAKLIMDLIWRHGIKGMLERVSVTARYGGLTVGRRVIDEDVKRKMRSFAERVTSGDFAREWLNFYRSGDLGEMMRRVEGHGIEEAGRRLRGIIFGE